VTYAAHEAPGSEYIRLRAIRVRDSARGVAASVDARRAFAIEVEYEVLRPADSLRVGVTILSADGSPLLSSTDVESVDGELARRPGRYVSRCTVPGDFLNYGQYFVSVGADFPMIQSHFLADRTLSFQVERTGGIAGHISDNRQGFLRMSLPWDVSEVAS
jgi:lipopolysaccharide transport system ATP-binding protein